MTPEIAEECSQNAAILAELRAIRAVLDRLEPLIPAMQRAATFLDNPVQRYRDAMRSKRT